jgi:pseudaminic acid biosynthesis-associated methylase
MISNINEQEKFWATEYADEYLRKNSKFDFERGVKAWRTMLRNATTPISSLLECGSNIGRNIGFLEEVLPEASKSIIELSPVAFKEVTSRYKFDQAFNGPIRASTFTPASFDLVYTCGVLIHIHPDDLLENMKKMFEYSKKYVLIGEYFNRTPVSLEYQGKSNLLFKRDFGKLFLENFDVHVVDYGFLWGHEYDCAGFDDITWWLFQKPGA